jgi:hypothetical protein
MATNIKSCSHLIDGIRKTSRDTLMDFYTRTKTIYVNHG